LEDDLFAIKASTDALEEMLSQKGGPAIHVAPPKSTHTGQPTSRFSSRTASPIRAAYDDLLGALTPRTCPRHDHCELRILTQKM
jgi:hypothetical protein